MDWIHTQVLSATREIKWPAPAMARQPQILRFVLQQVQDIRGQGVRGRFVVRRQDPLLAPRTSMQLNSSGLSFLAISCLKLIENKWFYLWTIAERNVFCSESMRQASSDSLYRHRHNHRSRELESMPSFGHAGMQVPTVQYAYSNKAQFICYYICTIRVQVHP